jgi:hypothetical protein
MKNTPTLGALLLATLICTGGTVRAGEGHDHGETPAAAAGPASPRFAAESELFELVGVLNGKRLMLYLDHYADNSPVPDARIDLDIGGTKFTAQQHDDAYEVIFPDTPKPGVLPVTVTIIAGKDSDLLAGELDIHDPAQTEAVSHTHSWKEAAPWSIAVIAGLVILLGITRTVAARRSPRLGGSA